MNSLPTLFLSHGAPDLPLRQGATTKFLRSLHQHLPKPTAILVISAHWHATVPTVSTAPHPRTIYDFSGFPDSLYQLRYPAPGAPQLADRIVHLLAQVGISCETHASRGFDHGAWTPLLLAYPAADIPVTQLSIQYHQNPHYHWKLGQALAPLRHEGVLIIGSGGITHNLYAFDTQYDAPPPDWVQQFDQWLAEAIEQKHWDALMQYRQLAPYAQENHPTEEHLLPLFVALGAGGTNPEGIPLHRGYTYGVLSMAAYAFANDC
ncbi:MAG: dioxygenase [Leptolyngbyaceae cyanobacterium SL_7_1]|nr:dioxygenase [Leptolyngbyaceae cyanobacterium SL_7_1]